MADIAVPTSGGKKKSKKDKVLIYGALGGVGLFVLVQVFGKRESGNATSSPGASVFAHEFNTALSQLREDLYDTFGKGTDDGLAPPGEIDKDQVKDKPKPKPKKKSKKKPKQGYTAPYVPPYVPGPPPPPAPQSAPKTSRPSPSVWPDYQYPSSFPWKPKPKSTPRVGGIPEDSRYPA